MKEMQTETEFVTQLLGMTEAFLGTIKAYKDAYILLNKSIEIPQYEVSFLMYLVWSYVENKTGFHPANYNPEFLFLKGLSCQKKSKNREIINWNQFVNKVTHSKDPLKEINGCFKTCDLQTFFNVNLNEFNLWKSEIKQTFLTLLRKDLVYGKTLQSLYFFTLISILSEYLKYNDKTKIDLYIKLLYIFGEKKFQEALKFVQIEFICLNNELDIKLADLYKCDDNFVDNFVAMLEFDDDAINALENIAGELSNYSRAFFDKYSQNERLSFLDSDFRTVNFRTVICMFLQLEDKGLEYNADLGSKYENFWYWLKLCICNGDK